MTAKLNLKPLINYFSDNTKIASRLKKLTTSSGLSLQAIEMKLEQMEDKGLGDTEEYKKLSEEADRLVETQGPTGELTREELVDRAWLAAMSRPEFYNAVKTNYAFSVEDGDYVVSSKVGPGKQWVFPDEASAKEKVLELIEWRSYDKFDRPETSGKGRVKKDPTTFASNQTKKLASTLVAIADQLDTSDPELAAEADSILQELYKQASEGCGSMEMGHEHSEECMGSPMMGSPMMDSEFGASPLEDMEPALEDVQEPEEEKDDITLDDLKDRLANMKWRVADKKGREAIEQAIEHVEKAQQYHDAKKSRLSKAHEIFDHAGLALRVKDFE
jgi:predicted DNA-binding protein